MAKVSNDFYRAILMNLILTTNNDNYFYCDKETYIHLASERLNNMFNSQKEMAIELYEKVMQVAYLDAIKILNAKIKENNINYEENNLYNKLISVRNICDLMKAIEKDQFLQEILLMFSVEFFAYNKLRKITLVKKLTEAQKSCLKIGFSIFANDLEEYDYKGKIPIEVLTDYYSEELRKAEQNQKNFDGNSVSQNLMEEIIGFIQMLAGFDHDSFEELMGDIITLDYKWTKYLVDSKLRIEMICMEEYIDRMNMYESNKLDVLINYEVLYDEYYLNTLVDALIAIKCDNLYADSKYLNEEIVENHFQEILKRNKSKNNE